MKAEDTIMSNDRIYVACVHGFGKKVEADNLTDEIELKRHEAAKQVAREKAEISFKAGIKEVVEWIHNHGGSLDGQRIEWHEQLKEWGIE